jgi:hypothetical protein
MKKLVLRKIKPIDQKPINFWTFIYVTFFLGLDIYLSYLVLYIVPYTFEKNPLGLTVITCADTLIVIIMFLLLFVFESFSFDKWWETYIVYLVVAITIGNGVLNNIIILINHFL